MSIVDFGFDVSDMTPGSHQRQSDAGRVLGDRTLMCTEGDCPCSGGPTEHGGAAGVSPRARGQCRCHAGTGEELGGWKRTGDSRAGRVCSEPPWHPSPRTSCACLWDSGRCQGGRIPGEGRLQARSREGGWGGCGATRALPLHAHTVLPGRERPSRAIYPTPGWPQTEGTWRRGPLKAPQRWWLCVHLHDMSAVHSRCFSTELRLKRPPPA